MQEKVIVRRDAGQVVAGDSVTHYHCQRSSRTQSHAVILVAFFGVVSAMYAIRATPAVIAASPSPAACYYNGGAYSVGSLALMGRVEKACVMVDGHPTWVRE